jgi:hypothetical protein
MKRIPGLIDEVSGSQTVLFDTQVSELARKGKLEALRVESAPFRVAALLHALTFFVVYMARSSGAHTERAGLMHFRKY